MIEIEICPKGREGPMAAFAGPLLKRVTEEGRPWAVVRAKGRVEKGQVNGCVVFDNSDCYYCG